MCTQTLLACVETREGRAVPCPRARCPPARTSPPRGRGRAGKAKGAAGAGRRGDCASTRVSWPPGRLGRGRKVTGRRLAGEGKGGGNGGLPHFPPPTVLWRGVRVFLTSREGQLTGTRGRASRARPGARFTYGPRTASGADGLPERRGHNAGRGLRTPSCPGNGACSKADTQKRAWTPSLGVVGAGPGYVALLAA